MAAQPNATSTCLSDEKILRAIFNQCLDRPIVLPHNPDADFRYELMAVCRKWKDVITTTGSYWNRLIFNPQQLRFPRRQLAIYHSYVQRSTKEMPLSLLFATETTRADETRKMIVTVLPKTTLKGPKVLKLLYGHGEINIVESLIIPYAARIHELHCIIMDYASHQSLSKIAPGAFSSLRVIDVCFVEARPSEPRSDLQAGYQFNFEAFTNVPRLETARIQIANGIHPLDLNFPWHQLTKLDLIDTVLPSRTLIRILQRCSQSLMEGFFTTDIDRHAKRNTPPYTIHMKSLIRFRLRTLHAQFDDQFERRLIFPSLKYIWIEKVISPVMHKWDFEHYASILSGSSSTLIQLFFSNLSISHKFHPKREKLLELEGRTSFHSLNNLFKALPNIQDLRLPSGIHLHPPTLEKIGTGELLPHLRVIEICTLFPDVIFSMLRRRNGIEAGPSDQRLRYSSISNVHLNLLVYSSTKREEITKLGNDLDLGISHDPNALILRFVGPCPCRFCFGG